MGRNPAWLSPKQVETLEWIRNGCLSSGAEVDVGRRIVARSLHRRGLVIVKGSGASWTAVMTKAGLAWQEAHPGPIANDTAADDLIQRVQAANGRLELPGGLEVEAAYKELVRVSNQSPDRPKGWRLALHNAGHWGEPRHEVILVRCFEDLVELTPVPVPHRVARYHPTVRAFLSEKRWRGDSKAHLDRAAHILQAIVDEATRRGLRMSSPEQAKVDASRRDAPAPDRACLVVRTSAGYYAVRIREQSASPGRLELIVDGPGTSYNGDRFRDTKTISVDDRPPRLFQALEIHRQQYELREQEREREAAERRQRWEAAMAEARVRYDEQLRWEAFERRSDDWHAANRHLAFLAIARETLDRYQGQARTEIAAQLDFAERRLHQLDPTGNLELILPTVPDPKPADLKEYLDGWSPYGPESSAW